MEPAYSHNRFYFYASSQYQSLIDQLAALVHPQSTGPFKSSWLIVNDLNQARAIKLRLAKINKLVANINFCTFEQWLFSLWQATTPQRNFKNLSFDSLRWEIFKSLRENRSAKSSRSDLDWLQSAQNYAVQIFYYLAYKKKLPYKLQNILRQLSSPHSKTAKFIDIEKLQSDLDRYLNQVGPPSGYEKVCFFDVEHLNPLAINFIKIIAPHIDINFLLFNPSPNYWFDDFAQKTSQILQLLSGNQKSLIGSLLYENLIQDFSDLALDLPVGKSLLHKFKRAIHDHAKDTPPLSANGKFEPTCPSLVLAKCYDTYQEAAYLRHSIAELLNKHKAAPPQILVIINNPEAYRSALLATFSAELAKNKDIFTAVLPVNDSLLDDFYDLCSMLVSEISIKDICDRLKRSSISQKFALTVEEIAEIEALLQKFGASWGLNNQHIINLGLSRGPDRDIDTVITAISKLWLSANANKSELSSGLKVAPKNSSRLLKKHLLASFQPELTSKIDKFKKFLSYYKLIKKWAGGQKGGLQRRRACLNYYRDLKTLAADFMLLTSVQQQKIDQLLSVILKADQATTKLLVDWSLIDYLLQQKMLALKNQQILSGLNHQGVKFVDLKHYHNLPADFTFVLGAHNSFIKQLDITTAGYLGKFSTETTLITNYGSKLLNAIFQTGKRLKISYVQDQQITDHSLSSSLLALRLKQWASANGYPEIELDPKRIDQIINHSKPLKKINQQARPLGWLESKNFAVENKISIRKLISFWSSPLKFYVQNQIKAEFNAHAKFTVYQPFDIEKQAKFQLASQIACKLLADLGKNTCEDFFAQVRPYLPEGQAGKLIFEEIFTAANDLVAKLGGAKHVYQRPLIKDIGIKHNSHDYRLEGEIGYLQSSYPIYIVPRIYWSAIISAHIKHLLLSINAKPAAKPTSFIIGSWQASGKHQPSLLKLTLGENLDAYQLLQPLCATYLEHQNNLFLLDGLAAKNHLLKAQADKNSETYIELATRSLQRLMQQQYIISDRQLAFKNWEQLLYQKFLTAQASKQAQLETVANILSNIELEVL